MADDTPTELTPAEVEARLAEVEAKREARKKPSLESKIQMLEDLEAIDELEVEHGEENIAVLVLPYSSGLPTRVACRTPRPVELKRYRHRVKPSKKGKEPPYTEAAEELAQVCLVYPNQETYSAVLESRGGVGVQLGLRALELASAENEAQGKD